MGKYATTSLAPSGGNHTIVMGDFSQMILALKGPARFEIFRSGEASDSNGKSYNAMSQLLTHVRCYIRCDVGCIRPDHFCKITGCTIPTYA
jgi:hypothetical protein